MVTMFEHCKFIARQLMTISVNSAFANHPAKVKPIGPLCDSYLGKGYCEYPRREQVTKVHRKWRPPSSRNCDEKCNQAVKAVDQETDCRQDMAGGANKRVHFVGDLGEGDDDYELEEAYEVYEVYDYITCVISKMVGGLRRKRKSCNGKERLGTPRPQASGGVRFACQEN